MASARRNFLAAAAIYFIAASSLLLIHCNVAAAQELWRGAEYGMTVEQVRKVVPEAVTPASEPSLLGDGSVELLRIDGYKVGAFEFDVSFSFKDGRLEHIALKREEKSWFSGKLVFEELTTLLRAKYGAEISSKDNSVGILKLQIREWLSGRTDIGLVALATDDGPATIGINYQVRIAKAADKL
jgi:hypothetical protein